MKGRFFVCAGLVALASFAAAQLRLPDGGDALRGVDVRGLLGGLNKGSGFTTSIEDALRAPRYLDELNPGEAQRLTLEGRSAEGTWTLKPGYYTVSLHTFCLKGYTPRPTQGMGYYLAPWKGPRAELFQTIVERYGLKNGAVEQADAQQLLWALLARTKPRALRGGAQKAMVALLKPEEIAALEVDALDILDDRVMGPLMRQVDKALQPLYEAENGVRKVATKANGTLEEMERLMVVDLERPLASLTPANRWMWHPAGYAVRLTTENGYRRKGFEIYVPPVPKIERDALGRITRLETAGGYVSSVEYDDSERPQTIPNDPNVLAYKIKSVRLIAPGQDETFAVSNFIFVRKRDAWRQDWLAALSPVPVQTPGWFDRWRERWERWNGHREDFDTLNGYRERWERGRTGRASADDFFDQDHYREGVESAVTGDTSDRLGWIADHHARQAEALAHATDIIGGLGEPEFDPSDAVYQPANPGGQRIGASSFPY